MNQLVGKPVSPGYAEGTAFVFGVSQAADVPSYSIEDAEVPAEHRRFHEAVQRSLCELRQLENRVLGELGQAQSAIFGAHLSLLQDENFATRLKQRVSRDLVNVEHALDAEVENLCKLLASVESEYVRERAQDIRDIGKRVMRQLVGHSVGHYAQLPSHSVIVARELLPSETIDLERQHVVAIVTEGGGENSHAVRVIVARHVSAHKPLQIAELDAAHHFLPGEQTQLVALDAEHEPALRPIDDLHRHQYPILALPDNLVH